MTTLYFEESLHAYYGQKFDIEKILFESKTKHQHLIIFENKYFGRVMALDGIVQTTQKDEFIYHEMLTHVPLFTHADPKKVLIVGGGDGGILREVAKHDSINQITMVEIDDTVVELSKAYFPDHSAGTFDDPRLLLLIDDAYHFITQCQTQFDVIIADTTDPMGPGEVLFSESFYAHCHRCLTDNGILVTQNGVCFFQKDEMKQTAQRFRGIFDEIKFYSAAIPTYIGGNMVFGWGRKNKLTSPSTEILKTRIDTANINTQYYNLAVHQACFALPNYVMDVFE